MASSIPYGRGVAPLKSTGPVVALAPRRPKVRAPRRYSGVLAFVALLAMCLLNINSVGAFVFGTDRVFSYLFLVLSAFLLLIYRLNVINALGRAGAFYVGFFAVFLLIAGSMNLSFEAVAWIQRAIEFRLLLSSLLIVVACALAVHSIALAYSPQTALRIVGIVALLVPASFYFAAAMPELVYRFRQEQLSAGRFSGLYANPNEAATVLCQTIAIGFACMVVERRRTLILIAIVGSAIAVLATFSRGLTLTMLALVFGQILFSPVVRRKSIFLAVGLVGIGAALLIFRLSQDVQSGLQADQKERVGTLASLLRGEFSHESTGGRLLYAMNGINYWLESPLLGHGIGLESAIRTKEMETAGSHNTFIRVLGEGGVVSGFLLLLFLFIFYREGRRCKIPYVKTLGLGYLIVLFMSCMTGHNVLTHRHQNAMLGISLGMLAAARQIDNAQRRNKALPSSAI
jgi:O-antigen ligase